MTAVLAVTASLVALLALLTVRTREPLSQLVVFSLFGASLAAMFLVLQAPDVALSQIVVGAVAYPVMVLLALAKVRDRER
jgi:energy-converting hydrogenase B subunit D